MKLREESCSVIKLRKNCSLPLRGTRLRIGNVERRVKLEDGMERRWNEFVGENAVSFSTLPLNPFLQFRGRMCVCEWREEDVKVNETERG